MDGSMNSATEQRTVHVLYFPNSNAAMHLFRQSFNAFHSNSINGCLTVWGLELDRLWWYFTHNVNIKKGYPSTYSNNTFRPAVLISRWTEPLTWQNVSFPVNVLTETVKNFDLINFHCIEVWVLKPYSWSLTGGYSRLWHCTTSLSQSRFGSQVYIHKSATSQLGQSVYVFLFHECVTIFFPYFLHIFHINIQAVSVKGVTDSPPQSLCGGVLVFG